MQGDYRFGQQIVVSHDGGEYLNWEARSWRLTEAGEYEANGLRETGFWRFVDDPADPGESQAIELLLAHSAGYVELFYGRPLSQSSWELVTDALARTAVRGSGGRGQTALRHRRRRRPGLRRGTRRRRRRPGASSVGTAVPVRRLIQWTDSSRTRCCMRPWRPRRWAAVRLPPPTPPPHRPPWSTARMRTASTSTASPNRPARPWGPHRVRPDRRRESIRRRGTPPCRRARRWRRGLPPSDDDGARHEPRLRNEAIRTRRVTMTGRGTTWSGPRAVVPGRTNRWLGGRVAAGIRLARAGDSSPGAASGQPPHMSISQSLAGPPPSLCTADRTRVPTCRQPDFPGSSVRLSGR